MKLDARYTITAEFCGYPKRQHVARFCGDWLGSAKTPKLAREIARKHRREFLAKISQ